MLFILYLLSIWITHYAHENSFYFIKYGHFNIGTCNTAWRFGKTKADDSSSTNESSSNVVEKRAGDWYQQ